MAEPRIMLEHRVTGARYIYCPYLATHPDMVRVVDDAQESAPAVAPAAKKAAPKKPSKPTPAVVDAEVVDVVDTALTVATPDVLPDDSAFDDQ